MRDDEVLRVKAHYGEDCKLNSGIIQRHEMSPRRGWALVPCSTCGKDVRVAFVPSSGGGLTRYIVEGSDRFPRRAGNRLYLEGERPDAIIVSRHQATIEWLGEQGVNAPVLAQVTEADVQGRNVYGNLPLHLAAVADTVTAVSLDVPAEMRGQELTLEEVRKYASLRTFVVRRHNARKPGGAPTCGAARLQNHL